MPESLALLTPTFGASGSGAATYYRLLSVMLAPELEQMTVISERGASPDGYQGRYIGLIPVRASLDRHRLRDLVRYGLQNLKYLQVPSIVQQLGATRFLVHSSFFNHPSTLPWVLGQLARYRRNGLRLIVDVRDGLLAESGIGVLDVFDAVIACSLNVKEQLLRGGTDPARVHYIPIPQEPLELDAQLSRASRKRLGLHSLQYVLYVGLIKEAKGVDLLLRAFIHTVAPARPDVMLVLAGLVKSGDPAILGALNHQKVRYLGNLTRPDVLAAIEGAAVCVNISPIEGMPRSSLEAVALGRPTVLPPNVPEFARCCPGDVAMSRDPNVIGKMILKKLQTPRQSAYPIGLHSPERLLPLYRRALSLAVNR